MLGHSFVLIARQGSLEQSFEPLDTAIVVVARVGQALFQVRADLPERVAFKRVHSESLALALG